MAGHREVLSDQETTFLVKRSSFVVVESVLVESLETRFHSDGRGEGLDIHVYGWHVFVQACGGGHLHIGKCRAFSWATKHDCQRRILEEGVVFHDTS